MKIWLIFSLRKVFSLSEGRGIWDRIIQPGKIIDSHTFDDADDLKRHSRDQILKWTDWSIY